jgi:hypothetical protein
VTSKRPLDRPRRYALRAIAAVISAASLTAFCESYRGLYLWATHHGLSGLWAAGFPLQVDIFVLVGELALFVALADQWRVRSRWPAWLVTLLGLAVSVAGNIGHIAGHDLASRATAAVPPIAAASALAVGLGVLKRVVAAGARQEPSGAAAGAAAARPELPVIDPAALADAPSTAARVRLAVAALGTDSPAMIRDELAAAGYPVALEAVRSALRKRKRRARLTARNVVSLPAARDAS